MGTRSNLTGLVVVGLLLIVAAGYQAMLTAGAVGARLPDTITLYVAQPSDQEVNWLAADAARHEAELAMRWLEGQAGRQLRRGPDFAEVIVLSGQAAGYTGVPESAYEQILADAQRSARDEGAFPVVLADVRTDAETARRNTCALGGPQGVVVLLRNCARQQLSEHSVWGSGASVVIAHELVHGLGAVFACAPHHSGDGHVTDDRTDILFHQAFQGVAPSQLTLDAGRDDYFGHGDPTCPDIGDSPLWDR